MKKIKWIILAGSAVVVMTVSILAVQAQTTELAVTCSGSVSGNQITWMANATGGNGPYTFAWSGDSSVAGKTSSSFALAYLVNGTYTANIQATDASSTVATSTCFATVTANVPTPTTSTLNVIVSVNNSLGGSAVASNFTVTVNGAAASPNAFAGASAGTAVIVTGDQAYTIGVSSIGNYVMSKSGNCSGPIAAGAADACTITEAYVPPSTPTSTLPRANQPMLMINPGGIFLARGMNVISVASGSFQAQIWGITYTINWSGNLRPEFYFRDGHGGNSTSSPSSQINVGDEVGVAGKINPASPMVIMANVVRDYSLTGPRSLPMKFRNEKEHEDEGNHFGQMKNGEDEDKMKDSASSGAMERLNGLMKQLRDLQELFKNRGGR